MILFSDVSELFNLNLVHKNSQTTILSRVFIKDIKHVLLLIILKDLPALIWENQSSQSAPRKIQFSGSDVLEFAWQNSDYFEKNLLKKDLSGLGWHQMLKASPLFCLTFGT